MTPCPFCGLENLEEIFVADNYMIKCNNCLACGPVQFSSDHAYKTWEERVIIKDDELEKELEECQRERDQFEEKIELLENKIESLNDDIEELKYDNEALKQELKEADREIRSLSK